MIDLVKGFSDRARDAQTVVDIMRQTLWENPEVKRRLVHVEYGYETHIPPEVRERMRHIYDSATARYIRFAPDFFVLDLHNSDCLYLLEYKCTRTPLFSSRRIEELRTKAKPGLDWQDIGQWEEAAHKNYLTLWGAGIRVAILNWCAYHPRLLLCDFMNKAENPLGCFSVSETFTGSRTPYVNLDLREFRTLADFLIAEHQLAGSRLACVIRDCCERAIDALCQVLPVTHDPRSPHAGIDPCRGRRQGKQG
jgi:hypothetical protein